jgi:hypothetical protein
MKNIILLVLLIGNSRLDAYNCTVVDESYCSGEWCYSWSYVECADGSGCSAHVATGPGESWYMSNCQ